MTDSDYLIQGMSLAANAVDELRKQLVDNQADVAVRCQLLGYFSKHRYQGDQCRTTHEELANWFIENCPKGTIASRSEVRMDLGSGYESGKRSWLGHLEAEPNNPILLANAAKFFREQDGELAESLYKRGKLLEPNNAYWSRQLAFLYGLMALRISDESARVATAEKALVEQELAYETASGEEKFSQLSRLPVIALNANELSKAVSYARKAIEAARTLSEHSSFSTAIHNANIVLALNYASSGDVENAVKHLGESYDQLGTSAPAGALGSEVRLLLRWLLDNDELAPVESYLHKCQVWHSEPRINRWISQLKAGIVPELEQE